MDKQSTSTVEDMDISEDEQLQLTDDSNYVLNLDEESETLVITIENNKSDVITIWPENLLTDRLFAQKPRSDH